MRQVSRIRGQQCGDIELTGYLANAAGLVFLVLDLHIAHERFGSSSDPSINGHLRYPNDVDRSLNEAASHKIRKLDIALIIITILLILYPSCLLLLLRLRGYIVNLCDFYSYKLIGKLTAFLQLQEFSLRKPTVDFSTSAARRSLRR
jgi:hypothetical protein